MELHVSVPFFNESARLDGGQLLRLAALPHTRVLCVDDGSTDGTGETLREIAARSDGSIGVLRLEQNRGKGEAVRRGLLHSLALEPGLVGYLDGDLSTPVHEFARLSDLARRLDLDAVIGSRVALLGRRIVRRWHRHYSGRVFATFASLVLRAPVYDTQCGAKVFRATEALRRCLDAPFHSRWAFDVELLGRLFHEVGCDRVIEEPLQEWADVPGSKVKLTDFPRALGELVVIESALRSYRRRSPRERAVRQSETGSRSIVD